MTRPANHDASPDPTEDRDLDLDRIRRLVHAELSLGARLGYVLLFLGAAVAVAVAGSLWLTEPALPRRTEVAFGGLVAIGLSWMAFAVWALTRRKVLYARQQIVAARMAVAFCAATIVGALVAVVATDLPLAATLAAAGAGVPLLALAIVVLIRARRHHEALLALRGVLEREAR